MEFGFKTLVPVGHTQLRSYSTTGGSMVAEARGYDERG